MCIDISDVARGGPGGHDPPIPENVKKLKRHLLLTQIGALFWVSKCEQNEIF